MPQACHGDAPHSQGSPQERLKSPGRSVCMAVVFFKTIPGLAVALVLLAALDRFGLWIHGSSGLPWYRDGHRAAPAAGFDELQAAFQSSKRHSIERRRLEDVLRDDGHDGASPHFRIDLGEGRAVIARAAYPPPADA